jgi:hypothetical protein
MTARITTSLPEVAVTSPLRGGLGQPQYVHLRPTGERAIESALLMPRPAGADTAGLMREYACRYLAAFGLGEPEALHTNDEWAGTVRPADVVFDEPSMFWQRPFDRFVVVLDSGDVVIRHADWAPPFVLRPFADALSWDRIQVGTMRRVRS